MKIKPPPTLTPYLFDVPEVSPYKRTLERKLNQHGYNFFVGEYGICGWYKTRYAEDSEACYHISYKHGAVCKTFTSLDEIELFIATLVRNAHHTHRCTYKFDQVVKNPRLINDTVGIALEEKSWFKRIANLA